MATIEYYFSLLSPYAYLGHAALLQAAQATGARIDYRPVKFLDVLAAAGGVPLKQRTLGRQRYRLLELQRWREWRRLPLNLHPRFFPVDPSLADRAVIALQRAGADPGAFAAGAFRIVWVEDRDLADPEVVVELLRRHGHDPERALALAAADDVAEQYAGNTQAAIAADLPGIPGYVIDGEAFWGQDRIELLQDALAHGRAPFRAM